ncbi:MAG: hypothetical protein M3Q31_07610 [Actinomycetota bacterium]|nr:hypothetical protein [Actinomycetota bacterium]
MKTLLDIALFAASVAGLVALWEAIAWLRAKRSHKTPADTDQTRTEKRERR